MWFIWVIFFLQKETRIDHRNGIITFIRQGKSLRVGCCPSSKSPLAALGENENERLCLGLPPWRDTGWLCVWLWAGSEGAASQAHLMAPPAEHSPQHLPRPAPHGSALTGVFLGICNSPAAAPARLNCPSPPFQFSAREPMIAVAVVVWEGSRDKALWVWRGLLYPPFPINSVILVPEF